MVSNLGGASAEREGLKRSARREGVERGTPPQDIIFKKWTFLRGQGGSVKLNLAHDPKKERVISTEGILSRRASSREEGFSR